MGVDVWEQGFPEARSRLCICQTPFLMTFAMGGIPHAGSRHQRSSIQSAKTRPGANCGPDHELLIAKFRLKLKKVGKTTGLLRYYLDQVPYDYPQEVTNRFKGLDLIARLKNYGRRLCHCTGGGDQHNSQEKRNAKRQNGCLRRPYK